MRVASFLAASTLVSGVATTSVVAAAAADAECTNASGTTVCAQGNVRGPDTGEGAGWSGPVVPYPCDYDWYCDSGWDLDVIIDPGPDRPGGIGPGRPSRPDRPGGGGGIGPRG